MSLGYIGYCKKASEDENTFFYAYSGANWNDKSHDKVDETAFDGVLAIDKSVLQWKPSKLKKHAEHLEWVRAALKNGQAAVASECSNAFYLFGIDYIALHLFYGIFKHLYETGEFPNSKTFIQ
jgi:hypothetical protein